jgi:hypothetical protein
VFRGTTRRRDGSHRFGQPTEFLRVRLIEISRMTNMGPIRPPKLAENADYHSQHTHALSRADRRARKMGRNGGPNERNVDNDKYSFYIMIGLHLLCLSWPSSSSLSPPFPTPPLVVHVRGGPHCPCRRFER